MKIRDIMISFTEGAKRSPSGDSVTIHGDRLYSYGEVICHRNGDLFVLSEPNRSSTTTVKHMNMAYSVLLNEKVPFIDNTIHNASRIKREKMHNIKRVKYDDKWSDHDA